MASLGKKKYIFVVSAVIILIGIISMAIQGLNLGIDFRGGTIITVDVKTDANQEDLKTIVASAGRQGYTDSKRGGSFLYHSFLYG